MAEQQKQQKQTREQNLKGRKVALLAQELQRRGPDLFSRPPVIERLDVLACKLP